MIEASYSYPTAPLALILSVAMTFWLFAKYPPARATFLALLISYLVLPTAYGWDLKGVTMLDKGTIPLFSSLAACAVMAPRAFANVRLTGLTFLLLVGVLGGPVVTALTNSDSFSVGPTVLPGLVPWDGVAIARELFFQIALPFLVGRMLVRRVAELEEFLRILVAAFLLYSIPMLFEIRMSPQLHNWVYGYFPHSFGQQARAGGFRPAVFVGHGLPLAIVTGYAVFASAVLWWRGRKIRGFSPPLVTLYLGGVLVLCKTLSAMSYAAAGSLTTFFTSPKTQARLAMLVAVIVLAYPMLRSYDYFPTKFLTSLSSSASEERSESLAFRFTNEEALLAHARERLLFGWGSYGRNRVFDPTEGTDITTIDGLWIILISQTGAVGFLSVFGLMLLPVFQTGRALRNIPSEAGRRVVSATALLVAMNWADSLPNALSGGYPLLFLTGAFSGVVATYRKPQPVRRARPERAVAATGTFGSPVPLR